jgi:Arc/MetJ-type ribon-helix-helix transcriptional regulator
MYTLSNMSQKPEKQVMVRLTPKLVKKVDAHAKYLRVSTGMTVSRTDAVKALLTEALDTREKRPR